MAWKNVMKFQKILNYNGNITNHKLSNMFGTVAPSTFGVFNLNNQVLFAPLGADYKTTFSTDATNQQFSCETTNIYWNSNLYTYIEDAENEYNHPLYKDGKFTVYNIPSGNVTYIVEGAGKGTITIYENEEPYETKVNSTISTPFLLRRHYYNPDVDSTTIRISGVNLNYAYITSAIYYRKETANPTGNTTYVVENLNNYTFSTETKPSTVLDNDNSCCLIGWKGYVCKVNKVTRSGSISNDAAETLCNYSQGMMIGKDRDNSFIEYYALPYLGEIPKDYNFANFPNIKRIQLGSKGYPVSTSVARTIQLPNVRTKLVIYTAGGAPLNITIENNYGVLEYREA